MTSMPYLLPMKGKTKKRDMMSALLGYNHNLRIKDGEFYDMRNMTSDLLPVARPRGGRGCVRKLTSPNGLFAHDKLCWVDGTDFYYDGAVKGTVSDTKKQFVRMGAYVLIWPDKKYYNAYTDEFGSLGAKAVTSTTVTAVLSRMDGEGYSYTAAATAPESPTDGQYWIDTSDTAHYLKMYSETYGTWETVDTVYVKISATGIGADFAEYDGISLSGMSDDALNGDFVIISRGDDYIVVTAIIDANTTQETAVTVERVIPEMDFLTEYQNRVWGCSSAKHEIYACKLGDPKNWNVFLGISTDSYAATVGSGGAFTGAATHMGYVMFFKEDRIHKLYGNVPSSFTLSEDTVRGVAAGSGSSLAVVNETLFYLSRGGMCAYGLELPESINEPLGWETYQNAVAGALLNKYYVCLEDQDGAHLMLVYDTRQGVWVKEDDTQALFMAGVGSDLYFIDADGYLWSVNGNIADYAQEAAEETDPPYPEPDFEWMLETGDIGLDTPDNKYISGIQIMAAAEDGASLKIEMNYDGSELWKTVHTFVMMPAKNVVALPFHTPRCYSMKLRMTGTGKISIYSITKTIETGSDVRV